MGSSRKRLGAMMLLSAAMLMSAICPHHAAMLDLSGVGAERAAPACHGSEPAPREDGRPARAVDCDCPTCGVESGLTLVAPDAVSVLMMAVAAVQEPPPTCTVPDARGHWMPPPYPGFSENTVVLRT